MARENKTFVMVYKGAPIDAYIVRSMIGSEGILAFLNDELMSIIVPGYIETKVLVPSAKADEALRIVERFKHPDASIENDDVFSP